MTRLAYSFMGAMLVATFALGEAHAEGGGETGRSVDAAEVARKFYAQGNSLYDAKKLAEAEAAYEKAWEAQQSYDVAAQLGAVELEQSKFTEAAEHLGYALKNFPAGGKPQVRAIVETRLGLARKEVTIITVHADAPNARVKVDGRALADSKEPVYLAPGRHVFDAEADGRLPAQQAVEARKGDSFDVNLKLALAPVAPKPTTSERSVVPAVIGGVLGVAGVGLGIGLLVASGGKGSDADTAAATLRAQGGGCKLPVPSAFTSGCDDLLSMRKSQDSLHNIGVVSLVAGGAVLAATATYLLWPRSRAATAGWNAAPVVGAGSGGLAVIGSF